MRTSSLASLGIVIIAAGNSSRLGQAKQLVEIAGVSLLQQSINMAERSSENSVCILGYAADRLGTKLKCSTCKILVNENWQQGMGSSISCGVNFLSGKVDAVMILLCDQYRLTGSDLDRLIQAWQSNPQKMIASQYFEKKCSKLIEAAPAIFPKSYFTSLMALKEKGARDILRKNQASVIAVLLKNAAFDLDTEDDLKLFKNWQQQNE
jgi:molybdenum cofactor cytidylyltransferase